MAEIQGLLSDLRNSLASLDLSHSNVSGKIFYLGMEMGILDPLNERVTIEAWKADGTPAIRDENYQEERIEDGVQYVYIRTSWSEELQRFSRLYVLKDWLKSVQEVNMSHTLISGHGLQSLAVATSSNLRMLSVSHCTFVDDKGIRGMVRCCKALEVIDVSFCQNVTAHGVLYLSEFQREQVKLLKAVDITNPHITSKACFALCAALDVKAFVGRLRFANEGRRQEYVGEERAVPYLVGLYRRAPDCIFDLSGTDITQCLLRYVEPNADVPLTTGSSQPSGPKYTLNLSRKLINDHILQVILSVWGPRLHTLDLSETYITETGLSSLEMCPNLRILNLDKCAGLVDKAKANHAIMTALSNMKDLEQLYIAHTCLSGRMFSACDDAHGRPLQVFHASGNLFASQSRSQQRTHACFSLHYRIRGCTNNTHNLRYTRQCVWSSHAARSML